MKLIGTMSGTSLDGLDVVLVTFQQVPFETSYDYIIHKAKTYPYSIEWVERLKKCDEQDDADYTLLVAECINDFMSDLDTSQIDAVCSHGHTIRHEPQNGITRQIGNSKLLAQLVKKTVVCDFRVQDVKLGGQGAPLVPIGDKLLFSKQKFCLNLGGFSNISYDDELLKRVAYDICPVNTILNRLASLIGQEYDKDGDLARQGILNQQLFEALNQLHYYKQDPPKSLGVEWIQLHMWPIIEKSDADVKDKLRTFTEHVAYQISQNVTHKQESVFVTGGGAWNKYLLERMVFYGLKILLPDKDTVDFKEALIFAFLGMLRLQNKVNVLSSVTGAKQDHSSGNIFHFQQQY